MEYEYHRIANIFPLMEGDEFKRLVDDIRANGLLESVVIYEGKILDGRNRYRACKAANVEPRFTDFGGIDPLSYVISKNRHRRHLTSSQLAAIAVQQEELMQELAEEARKHLITSTGGVEPQPLQTIVKAEPMHTDDRAASLFGTNRQYVQDAKRLKENAPDLLQDVASGKRTLPEAKKEQRKRETEARHAALLEQYQPTPELETMRQRYTLLHGDFSDIGHGIEADSIDAIITSASPPPWGAPFPALKTCPQDGLQGPYLRRAATTLPKHIQDAVCSGFLTEFHLTLVGGECVALHNTSLPCPCEQKPQRPPGRDGAPLTRRARP